MSRRIRPAVPSDIDTLVRLSAEIGHTAWSRTALEQDLAGETARFLLCEDHATPAGFIHWWRLSGEAEIMNVAVAASFRRQGVATALLGAMLEQAEEEGAGTVFLDVAEGNAAARGLYARLGFRSVGIRQKYYTESCENAIILQYSFVDTVG